MKKYLRITIMDRLGVCGNLQPKEYVVNRKFCEDWGIPFEGQTKETLRELLEEHCHKWGIQVVSIG